MAKTVLAAPIFRTITLAMQYPGNVDEICRRRGPEVLSRVLNYLMQTLSSLDATKRDGVWDEELVASIVALCYSQKQNHALKVQLFSNLLLDLKTWSLCSYGLQKKILSSLADMIFTESSVMREANAIQMLLDGCGRCCWITHEYDSVDMCSINEATRPVGEINALVDELLVVIELLVVAAPPSLAVDDVRCLLGFMVDCPQRNQGMETYFHAQFLDVEISSGKGRKASLHFTRVFKPQCWYFIGLEHTCKQGLLGKAESEMGLYIDGSLYEVRTFDFPRISKPHAFCCIETNPPPTMAGIQRRRRQCPLFAEIGPV